MGNNKRVRVFSKLVSISNDYRRNVGLLANLAPYQFLFCQIITAFIIHCQKLSTAYLKSFWRGEQMCLWWLRVCQDNSGIKTKYAYLLESGLFDTFDAWNKPLLAANDFKRKAEKTMLGGLRLYTCTLAWWFSFFGRSLSRKGIILCQLSYFLTHEHVIACLVQ